MEILKEIIAGRINEIAVKRERDLTLYDCLIMWHHGHKSQIPARLLPDVEAYMERKTLVKDRRRFPCHVSQSMPAIGARRGKIPARKGRQ